MKKIVAYEILIASTVNVLNDQVNDAISYGYQPHGFPFKLKGCICQTMVKFEGSEPAE